MFLFVLRTDVILRPNNIPVSIRALIDHEEISISLREAIYWCVVSAYDLTRRLCFSATECASAVLVVQNYVQVPLVEQPLLCGKSRSHVSFPCFPESSPCQVSSQELRISL